MITNRLIPAFAIATMLLGCEGKDPPPKPAAESAATPSRSSPPRERDARAAPVTSYAEAVERVSAGVVTIRAARRTRAPRQHPFFDNPALRDLFGGAQQRGPALQMGLGSGVIVKTDGAIITNHHVIDGAEQIKVELQNNRVYDAKVIGSDPPSDLAVLTIDARDLAALDLGDSDRVRVGDVVLAIGNPLGIGQTVTAGIISAKGRSTGLSDGSFEDFLQTDAPINQGHSGGALVNTEGELVGINSQILSTSGGSIGIGFAVPSNMARNVLDQLIANGRVRRGQLEWQLKLLHPKKQRSLGGRMLRVSSSEASRHKVLRHALASAPGTSLLSFRTNPFAMAIRFVTASPVRLPARKQN
jgi:S1-C subfamily serine protease